MANDGLTVLREYRRRGVATHMIMVLQDVSEAYGIDVVASVVSSETINNISPEVGEKTDIMKK